MSAIERASSAKMRSLFCLLVSLVAFAACSKKEPERSAAAEGAYVQSPQVVAQSLKSLGGSPARVAGLSSAPQSASSREQRQPAAPTRRVIRHGNQTLEVPRVDAALDAIRRMVGELGGYTTDESHQQDDNGRNTASITCRIAAEKLDDAIRRVRELGRQEELKITAEDITEAYFDLEIQVANQKRLETRLLELLNRQTNRLTDLLEIERETARVRGEIDQMEGKKRYWDNQLALSTLIVALHEPRPAIASAGGGPWRTLRQAFGDAGDNFVLTVAEIIAATGVLAPVVLALLFVILLLKWGRRRRRAAKARARTA